MSFTSVCASAGVNQPKHEHKANREAQKRTEGKGSGPHEVRNRTWLRFQGRSKPYFPARNIGLCNRRSSAEDISTSIGRDNITASPEWLRLFCQILMTTQNGRPIRAIHSGARDHQTGIRRHLLQSEASMADILPFRAFRYAQGKEPQRLSHAQVVTQPYDKITPALQDRYYAASPYNLVRIILGRHEADDNPANNVYSRAASYFSDWRQRGILRQDSRPSLYVYSQRFTPPDSTTPGSTTQWERRGFVALGRLEDYS